MFKKTTLFSCMLLVWATYADYMFPSSNPPGGKDPSQVTQYISFIWDDNGYSGKAGTNYEGPTTVKYQFNTQNWVNSTRTEGGWTPTTEQKNELNIVEGDIGMSWAAHTLAGRRVTPYKEWKNSINYEPPSHGADTVIYNDSIWACIDWLTVTGKDTVTYKTKAGNDTTVIFDTYDPPAILDTVTPGVLFDFKFYDHDLGAWVDTLVPWSALSVTDKADVVAKFDWNFVGVLDNTLFRANPDGSPIQFTFNVITGLMVPTWPIDWQSRESKYGYYVPNAEFYEEGYNPALTHSKIAVAWGREMAIYNSSAQNEVFVEGYINKAFEEARDAGHEIGNHTIDHMESNSPLPNKKGEPIASMPGATGMAYKDGFALWGSEGYDNSKIDTMPWYNDAGTALEVVNEAEQFGQRDGNIWQYMGWKMYSGRYLSEKAWAGAIAIGEEELDVNLDVSIGKGNLFGFRAPRLEVSSGLYYALKDLGYQYDCGLEEGYENNVDGTNFLWPYTTDNGSPNVVYQRSIGERVSIDSMPAGLWMIPSNVFIVHPDYRQETYDHHKSISDAALDGEPVQSFSDWVDGGARITGYDFNMWILWGMSKNAWLETMKYNTQMRLDNNKAPIHYGVHSDYYTPIYDYATLKNDVNEASYGQVVDKGWNTWQIRIEATEAYVDWAITNDCYFVSGHELIEKIKEMQAGEVVGQGKANTAAAWEFFKNGSLTSSTAQTSFTKDVSNANITVAAANGSEYPDAGYAFYEDAGYFEGMTHIGLTYKITTPVVLRLAMQNDNAWEVTLGNVGPEVKSGKIPLYAFHYNQYDTTGSKTSINTADIIGVEMKLLTSGEEEESHTVTLKDFVFFGASGGQGVDIEKGASLVNQVMKIHTFNSNSLNLGLSKAGKFSVDIMTLNGRKIRSFNNREFKAGINKLDLNSISKGVYLINIRDHKGSKTFKNYVM